MTRPTRRRGLAALAALTLILAACGGDDDDDGAATDETSATTDADSAAAELGPGVTDDAIKVGIAMVDYDSIKDFVDFKRGDQQAIAQVFVDYINENGGVGGRMIEPVYKLYPPIPGLEPSALSLCTQWTEDDEVFAVLGVFIDFTGDAQLCLTREHNTIHIGHELEQPWIDESPPGLMLTPDTTKEVAADILIDLLVENDTLEGRKVAILAEAKGEGRVEDVIKPALEDTGVEFGSTAILTVTGTDQAAAQAQLDSFIERWKTEDVDTVFMAGLTVSAKQFVEKIKDALPDAQLITDAASAALQAQDLVAAGTTPNPYEGMLSTDGESRSERWKDKNELLQTCVDVYEEETGTTLLGPDEITPGPDGKTEEIHAAVAEYCGDLLMFKAIAEKTGPELTTENWQATVDDFGPIELVTTDTASLCRDKYTADDGFRLVSFDSSIGLNGDWAGVTEVEDASGGKCA